LAHVIEIGAYGVDLNGTPQRFESLCNPGIDLRGCEEALKINGIREGEVLAARPIKEVADDFLEWLVRFSYEMDYEVILAGYNSDNYDGPILARSPWDLSPKLWKFDVMKMSIPPMDEAGVLPHHPYYKTPKWPKLSEAERFFGITREGTAHRALSDAKATYDILIKLLNVQKTGPEKEGASPVGNDTVQEREVI